MTGDGGRETEDGSSYQSSVISRQSSVVRRRSSMGGFRAFAGWRVEPEVVPQHHVPRVGSNFPSIP